MSSQVLHLPREVVVPQSGQSLAQAKRALRARIRESRARRPERERTLLDAARARAVLDALDDPAMAPVGCVACYLSTADEPGTLGLVAALHARGVRVLVPLLTGHRTPTFAAWQGPDRVRPGLWGIPEPLDADPAPLAAADLVLCSALAATPTGRRLGVGGGWYDRALPTRRPGVPVWALLNADEVLADLPTAAHDQPVDALVTEHGLQPVG